MKKITIAFLLVFISLIAFGPVIIQGYAEDMNFKLVSMFDKREVVKVAETEGVMLSVMDRKGLSIFDSGEIVPTNCRGIMDTKKGWQGYSSLIFKDGSTLVVSWKGPTSQSRSADGKYYEYGMSAEYVEGTGRFKGIKGSGTFTGKLPLWDEAYREKGATYYEFNGTYTLPSQ